LPPQSTKDSWLMVPAYDWSSAAAVEAVAGVATFRCLHLNSAGRAFVADNCSHLDHLQHIDPAMTTTV